MDRDVSQGLSEKITSLVGGPASRRMAQWYGLVPLIAEHETQYREMDDRQLRKQSLSLRYRARSGESLFRLLPEAFGLVRETARRTIGLRLFDVQLMNMLSKYYIVGFC